ncbi:putative zinc finger mynd-type protein [Botrytis fragariae]|uniref:Putative zinc finger mynd-type protein n=1 Tax=Botrytis fragariae TaxID=1964551 RepID=A0A8H6EH26_9HELO|nr:putative zinc finger mynd-type protein [Botrytis fragariae]KAF5871953.1 putative zinc finger mynd-type protein [Botrytis fragariae]
MPPRPSPTHKLGISFSPNSKSPELVWVNFRKIEIPGVDGQFVLPDVDRFLTYGSGDFFDSEQLLIKPQWIMRARNIKHTLAVYMRDNFGSDGSKMTQSASSNTAGKMEHAWKGPLIVVAMEGQSAPQSRTLKIGGVSLTVGSGVVFQRSIDITFRDFRVVHDYFLAYPHESESQLTLKDQYGNTVI